MTVEVNVAGFDIPEELPEDEGMPVQFMFINPSENFRYSSSKMETIDSKDDIKTFVISWNNVKLPEDEIVIKLSQFGFVAYSDPDPGQGYKTKDLEVIDDMEVEVRLPVSDIDFLESKKSKGSAKAAGIDYRAELSPYELVIYSDFDSLIAAGLDPEDPIEGWNEVQERFECFTEGVTRLHMLDGTVFSENQFSFSRTHLVTSKSVFRDEEERICAAVLSFDVPLDISQIDYIIIGDNITGDVRFDFAH